MGRGVDFKLIVGRALGWQMSESSRFVVSRVGDDFIFRGPGLGHGLGLCQEGAHVAARRGMGYRQILNHYFPGTRLTRVEPGRFDRSRLQPLPTAVPVMSQISSLKRVFLRRVAAPEFSRGFKPTGWLTNIPTSRQRRLNSIVADATRDENHGRRGFKPTAKFEAPLRGGESRSPSITRIRWMTSGGIQKSSLSSEHFRATYP